MFFNFYWKRKLKKIYFLLQNTSLSLIGSTKSEGKKKTEREIEDFGFRSSFHVEI